MLALRELTMSSIIVRLVLATLCGGVLGVERSSKNRGAGLRTYMLVCVGAALVMITNQYISGIFTSSDPARLGAQVISGIGFLGAGTIIVTRNQQVMGLTTAAALWTSACIGLAIGIGFYEGAISASVLVFFIISGLHYFSEKLISHSRSINLYVEFNHDGKLSELLNCLHGESIAIHHVEIVRSYDSKSAPTAALLSLKLPQRHMHYKVIEELHKVNGIHFIEEV